MHVSSATAGALSPAPNSHSLFALVRLLAREAARADFATCCDEQSGEVGHD